MQSNLILTLTDFNEASKEWNKNKKKTPEGYKYICQSTIGKTKRKCKTVCFKTSECCYVHRNNNLNVL